tara:strand:- start:2117 stop:3100 length:984 start_codon:yes stop_codon:yes gene_type:complete
MNGKNNLVVTVLLVLAVICILMTLNISLTPKLKTEGFQNNNNDNNKDINSLSKAELFEKYKELKRSHDELLSDEGGSRYVLKSELRPNESQMCTVSKAVDRHLHVPKSSCSGSGPKVDMSKYVLKSSIPPERVCPPPKEIDYSKYVLKSSIPPPQKCPPCICPKVKVSAGLCKTCPPPPKCPAPAPCPTVNCPEPKACPPQKYCPAPKPCSREKEVQVKYVQVPTVIQQRDPNSMSLLQSNNRANSKPLNNVSGNNSKLNGSNTINVGVEQEEDLDASVYSSYVPAEEYNSSNNNSDLVFNNYELNSKFTKRMGSDGITGYKNKMAF